MQRLRRLLGRRSARQAEGCFVAEGTKVLGEALAAGAPVESLYLAPEAGPAEHELADKALAAGCRVFDLAPGVIERVAGTVTPQPVIGVVGDVDVPLEEVLARRPGLVVVCAGVRDPGNAGTVLRSAEASGAGAVVFCEGSVDVYNPKTVRASAGAIFHVPVVVAGPAAATLERLGDAGVSRLGTAARGGQAHTDVDWRAPSAVVLGNEAGGLEAGLDAHLDGTVTIPMSGRSESLNVGMAAAVVCFEAARQRRGPAETDPSAIEVVSTVSHELRSPLTSVKGYTSLMLNRWERLGDEQKKMMLGQVNHDADRVVRLITELLDISRLETGRLVLRRHLVDLPKLAAGVVAKVGMEYPELEARVAFDPATPQVWADPDKLEQVITNLVENACKYASPRDITVEGGPAGASEVSVVVTDHGQGIPSEDLPKVFTKFFRRSEGKPTGSGLGLWISRGLVEAHGGRLSAESRPGQGTSFRFTLPLVDIEELQAQ